MLTNRIKGLVAGHVLGIATLLVGGCAEQQPARAESPGEHETTTRVEYQNKDQPATAPSKEEHYEMQRVIVSLAPTDVAVSDQVAALTKKYPSARMVRVISSFRQVVFEMPVSDIKLLEHEPDVEQVAPDRSNQPSN